MKVRYWFTGFLAWLLTDYYLAKLIMPSFVGIGDLQVWLQLMLLALQLVPLYTIGCFVISFVIIVFFAWLSEEIWHNLSKLEKALRRRVRSHD